VVPQILRTAAACVLNAARVALLQTVEINTSLLLPQPKVSPWPPGGPERALSSRRSVECSCVELFRPAQGRFRVHLDMDTKIMVVKLVPNFDMSAILRHASHPDREAKERPSTACQRTSAAHIRVMVVYRFIHSASSEVSALVLT
jgi:hypothetical protein